jgi:hypothetical protein
VIHVADYGAVGVAQMLLEAFFALGEWKRAKIITDGEVVTLDHVGAPNFRRCKRRFSSADRRI